MSVPKLVLVLLLGLSSCARPVPAPEPGDTASHDDAAVAAEPPSDAGATTFAQPPPTDAAIASREVAEPPGPADAATPTGCPTKLEGKPGPCTLGDRCEVPGGVCFCDGYHGGIAPRPGIDYSHWACGRSRNRTDGCPDDLAAGDRCRKNGQHCAGLEGLFCGPIYECRGHRWVFVVNNCSTIP